MKGFLVSLLLGLFLHGVLGSSKLFKREMPQLTTASNVSYSTVETPAEHGNSTTKETFYSTIEKYMPTIKNVFIFVCGFSTFLIGCLVFKIFRSGKKIRKIRKYDIITTPAERVEMTPLNEDNYDDEESAVFDVKYRYR
ncbi:membrane protein FAM174B [Pelobates fuscus]|uniref:membrane protein FAM174B n=1 Tax=Pelobates fuscus TaxID=191477 RepID=UPI002FE44DC0